MKSEQDQLKNERYFKQFDKAIQHDEFALAKGLIGFAFWILCSIGLFAFTVYSLK